MPLSISGSTTKARRAAASFNRLIHPIPTSAAPGAFRPLGLLRTPVLELDSFIGIGDEGRSLKKY
jgi:hypothetical protein